MPIRPSQRWFYPIDWAELSRAIRFGRAGGVCERCRRPHGRIVAHLGSAVVAGRTGLWWDGRDPYDGDRPFKLSLDRVLEHDSIVRDAGPSRGGDGTREGRWRCERGRVLPASILAPPSELATRVLQPAFWEGLETPVLAVRESLTVIACCHLDHDPTNCDPANLTALCGRCHLAHDRTDNLARRRAGRVAWRMDKAPALL